MDNEARSLADHPPPPIENLREMPRQGATQTHVQCIHSCSDLMALGRRTPECVSQILVHAVTVGRTMVQDRVLPRAQGMIDEAAVLIHVYTNFGLISFVQKALRL